MKCAAILVSICLWNLLIIKDVSAQNKLVAETQTVTKFGKGIDHYDSTIYFYPEKIRLKIPGDFSGLGPDSQAHISKRFFSGTNFGFGSQLDQVKYDNAGRIISLTGETWLKNSKIGKGGFITTYTNDSCYSMSHYDMDQLNKFTYRKDYCESPYYKSISWFSEPPNDTLTGMEETFKDSKGRIIEIKNKYIDIDNIFNRHYSEKRYWNGNDLTLIKISDFTRPDYQISVDSFVFNNKHQIIEDIYVWEAKFFSGYKGSRNIYNYSTNNNYSITHYNRSSQNGIDFIIDSTYVEKDSFELDNNKVIRHIQYRRNFVNDTFSPDFGREDIVRDSIQTILWMRYSYGIPDTITMFRSQMSTCGPVIIDYFNDNDSGKLKLSLTEYYFYDSNCNKILRYYNAKDHQRLHRWYYEPFKVALTELDLDFQITAFPNPATKSLTLAFDKYIGQCEIRIFDLLGRHLHKSEYQGYFKQQSINIEELPPGVYCYTLSTSLESHSGKFIKE